MLPIEALPVTTSFEQLLQKLKLTEAQAADNLQVEMWVRKHARQKYIPEWLLKVYGIELCSLVDF